ncbi:MAG: dihydroneopterin aldolase [Planctomycetes bacterium]|nr:dihydroneopterin aldolase [Planctomycetota bacterium]
MDKILIHDLQFHAHTGVPEAERLTGQRYSVDLELVCDVSKPGRSDDFRDAVDYAAVCRTVVEVGSGRHFALAEALAEAIAAAILDRFPVREVLIRAKKLHPPVSEIRGYFGVEIRRRKEQDSETDASQQK